jgi:predicted nucleotidyltransferase component of viral defense system
MIDWIRKEIQGEPRQALRRLKLAEVLQHLILQSLSRHEVFKNLVFTGGTALRILYKTGRYSEDLDFSLLRPRGFHFHPTLEKVGLELKKVGLPLEQKVKEERTVLLSEFRFPGILKKLDLSGHSDQNLTIKCEVDRNPPKGGEVEIALVTDPLSYTVSVFDLPSLFATKLHALFFRKYRKGRDYYDLVWYLGKGVHPNWILLNNAIAQTEGKGHEVTEVSFKDKLSNFLSQVDFSQLRSELERFLIRTEEVRLIDFDNIKSLLRNY